jgi:hypothetical protein
MEVSDVRRRLRGAIEEARTRAAERRAVADEASRVYEAFLERIAIPAFQIVQTALTGEGHRFKVETPAGSIRLVRERSAEEFVELSLDTERDVPAILLRSTRGRGRRMISSEKVLAEGPEIAELSDDAVVAALLNELVPLLER